MTTSESTNTRKASLARDLQHAARYYLGNRRALVILAIVALVGDVALNWSWLVAVGIAPILLTALPCLIMCGLGLCMNRMFGGSCTSQPLPPDKAELTVQSPISTQIAETTIAPPTCVPSCPHDGSAATKSADHQKS